MIKVFWFRKDLRLIDNNALSAFINSIEGQDNFSIIYIQNKCLSNYSGEKRISFLHENLIELQNNLNKHKIELNILRGNSFVIFENLVNKFGVVNIYANSQIEPYCIKRDKKIKELVENKSGKFICLSDTTLMDMQKISKDDSSPYTVFTPFKNKFLEQLSGKNYIKKKINFSKMNPGNQIRLTDFPGCNLENEYKKLNKSDFIKGGRINGIKQLNNFVKKKIKDYGTNRDFPALNGTSLLSAHLHFGTISIRECFRAISKLKISEDVGKWQSELIWREFYYNIAYNFPYIENSSFKKEFDKLNWNYNKKLFKLWCDGKTGFPIVDAGMRQLKKEGWMHNRVRMIVAMFLTKDLFIDWRLGERYFADNLIDFDFALNNGGWQWSSSTGCDAQPYFRIFNPYLQSKKYDPEGIFIKKYIMELKNIPVKYIHKPSEMPVEDQQKYGVIIGKDYPTPVVNHSIASKVAIENFKQIRNKNFIN